MPIVAAPWIVSDELWELVERCCRASSGVFVIQVAGGCLIGRRCKGSCLCCTRGSRGRICRKSLVSGPASPAGVAWMSGNRPVCGTVCMDCCWRTARAGEIEWSRAVADSSQIQAKKGAPRLARAQLAQPVPAPSSISSSMRAASLSLTVAGATGGTGAGAGVNASCTTRSTFARLPFLDRHEAAELEPAELDAALRADGDEAELVEEVAREDRPVDEEALLDRLALRVSVRERLDRLRAAVARLADRSQQQRLLDPLRPVPDEVRAGHERPRLRMPGRRAGRRHVERGAMARTAASRAGGLPRRDRSSPTRPSPPRRALSSAPSMRSGCPATATTRSRDRRTERIRSSRG